MQVPLPDTEPRLNSPRATECQVTVFPGKIHLANLRRLFIGESKGKRVHGLWRRIDSVMDDAADDSFEEISFFLFSFIFVLEVYIYRERDISLTKIWRKFRNELSFYYSLWNK